MVTGHVAAAAAQLAKRRLRTFLTGRIGKHEMPQSLEVRGEERQRFSPTTGLSGTALAAARASGSLRELSNPACLMFSGSNPASAPQESGGERGIHIRPQPADFQGLSSNYEFQYHPKVPPIEWVVGKCLRRKARR